MPEDKRQHEIIRIQKKRNNFVMLDKGFLEDSRLSYKAKGILAYLLGKPDNWKVIVKDLINHSKDGRKAVYSGLNELKEYGYYKKIPVRNETNRRISHWESVIYESPEEQPEDSGEKSLLPPFGIIEENADKSATSLFLPFVHIDNVNIQNEDIQKGERNKNYSNNTYLNDIGIKSSQSLTELKNDLTMTFDEDTRTQQLHIDDIKKELSTSPTAKSDKVKRPLEITQYNNDYNTYLAIIQENIEYNHYLQNCNTNIDMIDELINCMLDVMCTSGETVKINGEEKNRNMVKSVYLQLNQMDIEHVLDRYKDQYHKITHHHNYLKTMLYTVKQEGSHFYMNLVNKNMTKEIYVDNQTNN